MDRVQTDNFTPRPLVRLQNYLAELKPCKNVDDKTLSLNEVIRSCKTEMYHYARVSGLHVLECVMDTALSAVKREQLEEASNVCTNFCFTLMNKYLLLYQLLYRVVSFNSPHSLHRCTFKYKLMYLFVAGPPIVSTTSAFSSCHGLGSIGW
jgi:hypothetical protein